MMHPSLPRECDEGVDFAEDLPRLLDRSLGGRDLVAADREFASAALKPILAAANSPFELEEPESDMFGSGSFLNRILCWIPIYHGIYIHYVVWFQHWK